MDVVMSKMDLSESAYIQLAKDQVRSRLEEWKRWSAVHLNVPTHSHSHHKRQEESPQPGVRPFLKP
jgi:hypothetical protein